MLKVFLSSTSQDLSECREALRDTINGLDGYHCVAMEDFGARDADAGSLCDEKVGECDLFVGVLGHLYGTQAEEGGISYTEREYDTAVRLGKPRLMFLAAEDFRQSVSLRESDDKWRRQQSFRQRVSGERVRVMFHDAEELCKQVSQAIHNLRAQLPAADSAPEKTATPAELSGPPPAHKPHRGAFVSKMCDRSSQEQVFSDFFSASVLEMPGHPQVYILRAPENESPGSLIQRFHLTTIQDYANQTLTEARGVVRHEVIDWPHEGALEARVRRLKRHLFRMFDPTYEFRQTDYSAAAFDKVTNLVDYVVIIRHEVWASKWDDASAAVIKEYLRFWDDLAGHKPAPQFFVFIAVIYPSGPPAGWFASFFRRGRFEKSRVEAELTELVGRREAAAREAGRGRGCPCLLLDELRCVEPHDVMRWFSQHNIYDNMKVRKQKCDRLFEAETCRNMADVEHELKNIHEEFLKEESVGR